MAERPSASWMMANASKFEETGPESTFDEHPTLLPFGLRKVTPKKEDRGERELNKRLREVYISEDKDYGDDVTGETLIRRMKSSCSMAASQIDKIMEEVNRSYAVDLCFMVDCTSSMQAYIDEVRNSIFNIVDKSIGPSRAANSIRCAFVGYRDFVDTKQFECFDFTENVNDFKSFCQSITATGGGDTAEDVFGGLENAIGLNWNPLGGTRKIFHIADAPCHGEEYHDKQLSDDHPSGDPKGRNASDIFARIRRNFIQYHFGKVHECTNLMIRKFSEHYGEDIITFNMNDVRMMETAVVESITISVSRAIEESKTGTKGKLLREYTMDTKEPNWAEVRIENGSFLSYKLPISIEALLQPLHYLERKLTKHVRVKVAPNPFSQGSERVAYYGRNLSHVEKTTRTESEEKVDKDGVQTVFKEYKHIGRGLNTHQRYEISAQIQTVATFFALRFDKLHKEPVRIKFLKVKTLCIPSDTGRSRYMTCEKLLTNSSSFIRFTNNVDYQIMKDKAIARGVTAEQVSLLMAFSHWTYEVTNGHLMIVDLQGVVCTDEKSKGDVLLLTDPAIHSLDPTRYRPLNLGKQGMAGFFKNHECNAVCQSLKLKERP